MTDPTPRPDDELVSAVLDGEATADERARVEDDPAARLRLAELRAARDRVATPVAVPAAAREAAVTAALDLFDSSIAGSDDAVRARPAAVPPIDELGARRARRGGPNGRFLAVAAAILVVLVGAGAVVRALNPPSELTAATSADQNDARSEPQVSSGGPGDAPSTQTEAGATATTTTALDDLTSTPSTTMPSLPATSDQLATVVAADLGTVSTPRELRDRMLDLVDSSAADSSSGAPAPTTAPAGPGSGPMLSAFASCASYLDAVDPELDQLLAVGAATYQGQAATVYAFSIDQGTHPAANGSVRIYAVDPVTCATVSVLTTR